MPEGSKVDKFVVDGLEENPVVVLFAGPKAVWFRFGQSMLEAGDTGVEDTTEYLVVS